MNTTPSHAKLVRSAIGFAGAGIVSAAHGQAVAAHGPETVVVTGQLTRGEELLPQTILNTAQSINVIPADVMREQGVSRLVDALRNVPGITFNAGEGGGHGDLINLRGFSLDGDYFMDGFRDTAIYDRDVFDDESVVVLKGPSATLFGQGTTGGVINQVMKSPQLYPIDDLTVTGGTNSEARLTADLNYQLGDTTAVRFNLMGQRSMQAGRPFAKTQTWGAAPSIAFGLGTDTTFTIKYFHQQEDNIPDYGMPFLFDRPPPVPRNTFYSLPNFDRFKTDVEIATGQFEHKFSDEWSMTEALRYNSAYYFSPETPGNLGSANCFISASTPGYFEGAPLCTGAQEDWPVTPRTPFFPIQGTPLSTISITHGMPLSHESLTSWTDQLSAEGRFVTGPFDHALRFGVQFDVQDSSYTEYAPAFLSPRPLPTPLLKPDPYEPAIMPPPDYTSHGSAQTTSLYATDVVSFGAHWLATIAIRFDHFAEIDDTGDFKFGDFISRIHVQSGADAWSPRFALIYKPDDTASIYFSYGTSFNPQSALAPFDDVSTSTDHAALVIPPPETDHTFEFGGKTRLLNGMLDLTAAVFTIRKENALQLHPGVGTYQNEATVNGFEINATGNITERWEIIAGYTYLDASAVGLYGENVRGPLPNTAHNQANLWTTYDFEMGLQLGTGINFDGMRRVGLDTSTVPGTTQTVIAPAYITWDGMIGYKFNDTVGLQLNAYNMLDTYYMASTYFTSITENHAVPGPGRSLLLSAIISL